MVGHEASHQVEGVIHTPHHQMKLGWWNEGQNGHGRVRRKKKAGFGDVVEVHHAFLWTIGFPVASVVPQ